MGEGVPYHQSLFDLLDWDLPESAEARAMIEEAERACRREVPGSVRQWYLLDDVVSLAEGERGSSDARGGLWWDFSEEDTPFTLYYVVGKWGAGGRNVEEP